MTVNDFEGPGVEIMASPEELCVGESSELTASAQGGTPPYNYEWNHNLGSGPVKTVSPVSPTTYRVTVTDGNGCQAINQILITLKATAKIGDRVWFDTDMNGIQDFYLFDPDLDEPGINGVTVNLYKANNPNEVYKTQITHPHVDTFGYYEFEVCMGDYFIEFIKPQGQGYIFTPKDRGADDILDSDADENSGKTDVFHLNAGEIDHSIDVGLFKYARIGDYVWHDKNGNGIQDMDEEGISHIKVSLNKGDGTVVGDTYTSTWGYYSFNNLVPGEYYLCFDYSGSGYQKISPKNIGSDKEKDSDVDPLSGCTETTTIIAGEVDVSWDLGLYNLAGLGDWVWEDINANGCQDNEEPGIEGVIVRLFADIDKNGIPDGNPLGTTQTDEDGFYQFIDLPIGTYIVQFQTPNGYIPTVQNNTDVNGCGDNKDSDGNPVFGYSDPVDLGDNEYNPTIDQGFYKSGKLGDFVWYDKNANGIQDFNEDGVSGVTVTLYKDTDFDGIPDQAVSTKVSNTGLESGKYIFDDLMPGVYKICFDTDGNYDGFSDYDMGTNDTKDSDVDKITGCTGIIVLTSGEINLTNDAGLIKYAKIGNYVWEDDNADGYQDPTEKPIAGVEVNLKDENGTILQTTQTDVNGFYLFDKLLPGIYIVNFVKPSGFKLTYKDNVASDSKDSDADPTSGDSHQITLEGGDSDMTIDAGFFKLASIGDYVWEDVNINGDQDPFENGINDIQVTLYNSNHIALKTVNTGTNPNTGEAGFYKFDNLIPGIYYICFDKGDYDSYTIKNRASYNRDSDADANSGCTELTILKSGENDMTWDAGLYNYAGLGDYVWDDANYNGIQDLDETGINGVSVVLYKDNDKNGIPEGTPIGYYTTSDYQGDPGFYQFTGLVPGNYLIQFPDIPGYERTDQNRGLDSTKDSNPVKLSGLTGTITLSSGEFDSTIDAGYFQTAKLGDYVWLDEDGDGIQDANEKCINGVKVVLYRVQPNDQNPLQLDTLKLDSTYTKPVILGGDTLSCGFYEFSKLKPGNYFLWFENQDTLNYRSSPKEKLFNKAKDSNIDENGFTDIISLKSGENNRTIDAGFYYGNCMEGFVWYEKNDNPLNIPDVRDSSDTPVQNIDVKLYSDKDEYNSYDDKLVMSTVTDFEGRYRFENVPLGTYFVTIDVPNQLYVVHNDVGPNDMTDSDFYLSEETGQYRTHTFSVESKVDDECIKYIDGGLTDTLPILPLTLIEFKANWNSKSKSVDLNWKAENEINIAKYNIERKGPSKMEFNKIGEMEAMNLERNTKYSFNDNNVENGQIYYYRLKILDFDGAYLNSMVKSVIIPSNKFDVIYYPNPAMDKLVVIVENLSTDIIIDLMDNVGRKAIRSIKVRGENNRLRKIEIDLDNIPEGQYFLKVVSGQNVSINKVIHLK